MRVIDTGIGIPNDQFEHIFEEFGQIENPLQARTKGTGLGLALSRRLAEMLGGTLEVSSTVGAGSTFTLRIPRVHPEVSEYQRLQTREIDPARAPLLVVEDDRKTIFIYEKYLAMAGFQVVPARSIEDAERIMAKTRPAAVVLDVMLDGETSWNFLARLKKDPDTHDIPVLVVTVTAKEERARPRRRRVLDQTGRSGATAAQARLAPRTDRGKVLVIDDDERALSHAQASGRRRVPALRSRLGAGGGRHGADAPAARHPARLPDGRGDAFDVLDELKGDARTRSIPVIIITSHALQPEERRRLEADTEVILSKQSLSREIAINRIRDALRKAGVGVAPPQANRP